MTASTWYPLGFWGTVQFFLFERHPRAASWRHFGWELEIELTRRSYNWWLHKREEQ